ncbi:MAG: NAD(P)/FAD-dependent oxidoreductase [Fretibacterium sp.]|nr:NAD(P)/FAD-dependent oxidoreductase [Fretibacterium sp.]
MERFDTIIIGGGPAGLMAAIQASSAGERVLLLEKNANLGVKLLLSGRGRCNFTNGEENTDAFLDRYGENGRFLYSAFSRFGPAQTLDFFHQNGVETVMERGKRIFPVPGRADSGGQRILDVLLLLCKKGNVRILRNASVKAMKVRKPRREGELAHAERLITGVEELEAKRYIIATGGKSYPKTGSTGDGYRFAQAAGHTIVPTYPALVPIRTRETWVKLAHGCNLRNVNITVMVNGRKAEEHFGEMEFTNFGVSGPIVMEMSARVPDWIDEAKRGTSPEEKGEAPGGGVVQLSLDLKPALPHDKLRTRIAQDFQTEGSRRFDGALRRLVPGHLIPMILELSDVPPDKPVAYISSEEIEALTRLLKDIRLTVNGLWSFNNAVVTRGGVSLKEVDPRTMRSRLCDNLYFAGEVLDLNGPSGGFNLQVCWSTGYIAGRAAEA